MLKRSRVKVTALVGSCESILQTELYFWFHIIPCHHGVTATGVDDNGDGGCRCDSGSKSAVSSLLTCAQVMLHGCILSDRNVDTVLSGIRRDLEKIETSLANSMLEVIPGHRDVSPN